MLINHGNLRALYVAFKAAFQGGFDQAASQYTEIATVVPSTTGAEEYGWLGQMTNMREWIGDRVVHGIAQHGYTVKNKEFELTIGVPRKAIEDDQYGVYTPLFREMGRSSAAHPDQLVFGLLAAGLTTPCYDGQNFFSATHPVLNAKGVAANQSNIDDTGSGTRWYVFDTSRALKPLIHQDRKKPNFVAKDKETDDNVFDRAEYKYGVDSRGNAGFGFWQLAQTSNKTLNEANLTAAITALSSRKGDYARPLGLNATLLVVPPTLEFVARALLVSELVAVDGGGSKSNPLQNRLKLLVSPWLD